MAVLASKIVVALNDLPESKRVLRTAVDLAVSLNASLATVSILGDLPAYAAFATIVAPCTPLEMKEEQRRLHGLAHSEAELLAVSMDSLLPLTSWRGERFMLCFSFCENSTPTSW
jgi:hypothetical protein